MSDRIGALRALTWTEWVFAGRVAVRIPLAALAARCLSLGRASRAMAELPRAGSPLSVSRAARLVDGVGRALHASCLTRALVLHGVLARWGEPASVVIGTSRTVDGIRSHAWVEHAGQVVSPEGADGYLPLCRVDTGGARNALTA